MRSVYQGVCLPHVFFIIIPDVIIDRVYCREELYTDVRLNDTLCERYQLHMEEYDRKVLKRHDKVLTASSDIGMSCQPRYLGEPFAGVELTLFGRRKC